MTKMRKIYVLDEAGHLQEIDAGITEYSELRDAPIYTTYNGVQLVNSTVSLNQQEELVITAAEGVNAWSDAELLTFCSKATDGRYDVLTAAQGHEILLIDSTNEKLGRRYRRIGVDQDQIYDLDIAKWITITDTTAKNLIFQFLNQDEIKDSMVVGDPLVLKFYYYSNVGTARVTVTMNGTTFTVGTVSSGENIDIDLTRRVVDGSNKISVKFTNDATYAFVPELDINGINITYSPEFNQYKNFSDNINFDYACSGSSNKVVHFEVINANGETYHHSVAHNAGYYGSSATLKAEWFAKGENTIKTYMQAVDENGAEVTRTITTTYKIPFLTDDDPLLMVYYEDWNDLKQYASISIPYYIWKRGETAASLDSIKFAMESDAITPNGKIEYEYNTSDPGALVNYLQYNTVHRWLISSLPTSYIGTEDKKMAFSIQGIYGESSTNKYLKTGVTVKSSSSAMQTVEGYKFNFSATDLTRATDIWTSTGTDVKTMTLKDFNWNTDGIQIDEEGNQSLHFAPAATAVLSETTNPLFGAYNQRYSLEVSFKVAASASEDVIAKYYDPNAMNPDAYGLFIYPNKALFKYSGGTSEINYIAGERTHLAYVICNKTVTDEDLTTGQGTKTANMLYLFVYLNGILSQMKPIATNTTFPSNCGTMEFNCNNNDFDLYVFRGYSTSLSSAQVLQNYIATFGDAAKKEQIYLANNLYDATKSTGVQGEFEIDFNQVKGKIPCYVMVMDTLPRTKDYLNVLGIYYEKEGEVNVEPGAWVEKMKQDLTGIPKATTYYYYREQKKDADGNVIPGQYTAWKRNKPIEVGGQGTSSLAYPRHNFKFKHNKNNQFYIKGHTAGPDRTFTFKADYMDSSGANNIGNAQVLDNAIVREKWVGTPVASKPNLRVNLDGFPVAVFWCQSSNGLKGGVVQDENAKDVFDHKDKPLYDAITVNSENPLVGEVTPLNPKYLGTFNFNYDKKAKKLLGWDEDIFQGFEFRGNSSKCNLFRGFENFSAFASTSEGFEWRWTWCSDFIDDFHDGNLDVTIDGGYVKEVEIEDDTAIVAGTEAEYLAGDADCIDAYNRYYVEKDGKQLQLVLANEDGTYSPINYISFNEGNKNWKISKCEGISKPDIGICLEYGVKLAEKDGVMSLVYQLPYGISNEEPLGKEYEDGSHYYKFSWNPEHEFKFEYNTEAEYFQNIDNWTAFAPITQIKAKKISYVENAEGTHIYDNDLAEYHTMAAYAADTDFDKLDKEGNRLFSEERYNEVVEYLDLDGTEEVITWDYMKFTMKNWCYVNEAINHCDVKDARSVLDSNITWGDNGKGLFVWDALTNYMAASITTGLCDNFAKNMFMHSYDGGLTWSPAWYDMDTCFGLNNEGAYTKMYDVDFMDLDSTGARAFNGSNSKLWEIIYYNYANQLQSMYQYLRTNNYISYDKIMNVIDDGNIKYKSEAMYNANAVFRYMEPLAWHSNVKPEAAQGNRLPLLKYWNSKRQTFLDSRYEGTGWTTDTIVLRLNNTQPVTFNLVPDTNMFLGANFNSGQATVPSVKSPTKILAGEAWQCSYGASTNLNTYIYGASHLLEVGDLSLCNSTEYSVATAVNLRELKIGDEVHPPKVTTKLNLSTVTPYTNLKLLDLTNVSLDNPNLNLTFGESGKNLTPALQVLKLKGSNTEYLTLADYTPLTYLSLSDNLRNVVLKNLLVLKELYPGNLSSVETVTILNCPVVDQYELIKHLVNRNVTISIDNLQVPKEKAVNSQWMDWLVNIKATVSGGHIFVQGLDESVLDKYKTQWPDVQFELEQIFADEVIFGVSGEGE